MCLIPRRCNIDGLVGETPDGKHVLPVGRDDPRVLDVDDSLIFLPGRDGR